ncbi:histidine kinase [Chitinophagaceae bacterium LB-8]|uniref:Histidine kinase n=1 Tax=Paraflavisolibacter caeni TaxID=2982496 RepID=A0A9X3B9S1_9BACT|nr:histidine kinase [Paraflavisolibacter caeni]MCU7552380.1 histidine kinase [Paraflavisolibacter caeni]
MSAVRVLVSNLSFIATSYIIWQGSVWIISNVRRNKTIRKKIFLKLFLLCSLTALYGFTIATASALLWQTISLKNNYIQPALNCGFIAAGIVMFLTLVYEALFLSKERELDVMIVDQLDKERLQAELSAVKGELEPHFVFNSLTTLSQLISVDAEKAQMFTNKLAVVYKYLLINKDKELISLEDELNFIDDYFYLLRIRYDHKINLHLNFSKGEESIMIIPCSLQLLIENAIKHNYFTEADPLQIMISLNGEYLKVENNKRSKNYAVVSTKVGLAKLRTHYRLICNKDIVIYEKDSRFIVKIPLIKQEQL